MPLQPDQCPQPIIGNGLAQFGIAVVRDRKRKVPETISANSLPELHAPHLSEYAPRIVNRFGWIP
ncbi:hypothetical protein OS176_12745 [Xanthomonadaceae bacterium XH05]|nr:hypothetical protein [Xanthomonadaceae bacterium XH05]